MKKRLLLTATLLAVILILVLARPLILRGMSALIVTDDNPKPQALAIVLLMGAVAERTPHAFDLYKKNFAPKIVFARNESHKEIELGYKWNEGEASFNYLQKLGVPTQDLIYLNDTAVTSTFEEAEALLSELARLYPERGRLILVTGWYHTSRAKWAFQKAGLRGFTLEASPAMTEESRPDNWWQSEVGFLCLFNEYLRWAYYLYRY